MPAEEAPAIRTLTPSELVYFHAEGFVRERSLLDSIELLHSDRNVRASDLARTVLATAILAAEDAGVVRLREGQKSKLFGLRKVPAVIVERASSTSPFPPSTLEQRVHEAMGAAAERDVESLVYELLREDAPAPAAWTVQLLHGGLEKGGVLVSEEKRVLKIMKTFVYRLPDAHRDAAVAQPPEPARRLLEGAQKGRPEAWALMTKAIDAALARRRETSDGPDHD